MYGCKKVAADIDTKLGHIALARGQSGAKLPPVLHPENTLCIIGEDVVQRYFNLQNSCNAVMMK